MQAIIRRAKQLGKISENQYEYLFKQMGYRGYRTCEPVPIPQEQPRLLPELMKVQKFAAKGDLSPICERLGVFEAELQTGYWHDLSGLRLVI
jgi:Zn-dependent peptidase ImmA (M78 family)